MCASTGKQCWHSSVCTQGDGTCKIQYTHSDNDIFGIRLKIKLLKIRTKTTIQYRKNKTKTIALVMMALPRSHSGWRELWAICFHRLTNQNWLMWVSNKVTVVGMTCGHYVCRYRLDSMYVCMSVCMYVPMHVYMI